MFAYNFSKIQESMSFAKYLISRYLISLFLYIAHQSITKVIFMLSVISISLELLSVNYTSI